MAREIMIVTGASTGIGLASVKAFSEKGYTVFGTVRKAEDAERLRQIPNAHPLMADVTDHTTVTTAAETVEAFLQADDNVAGLVNNAGIAISGPISDVPLKWVKTQFDVNVIGLMAVTQAFLPLLKRGTPGRVMNISSVAGKVVSPFLGVYAASKHAVEALSDALRRELMPFGVKVIIIEPGPIATPIWDKGIEDAIKFYVDTPYAPVLKRLVKYFVTGGKNGLPATAVAKLILSAMEHPNPKTRYLITPDKRSFWMGRLLPDKWLDKMVFNRLGMAELAEK